MSTAYSRVWWTVGLMGVSVVAFAGDPKPAPKSEPVGFITGGVIGGLAAGPFGAVIGAGVGTWLGNRVHRAGEANRAQIEVARLEGDNTRLQSQTAALQSEKTALQSEQSALLTRTTDLASANRVLTAQLEQAPPTVDADPDAAASRALAAAKLLDGLQGNVLFRTASADVEPEMVRAIQVLAEAVAKSPDLTVRIDGFADARGPVDANLKLSQSRADAVRDLMLAAGVSEEVLEVNAYGKSQSVAHDEDGYALERHVSLTLRAGSPASTAELE